MKLKQIPTCLGLMCLLTACRSYQPELPIQEIPPLWREITPSSDIPSENSFCRGINRFWELFEDPYLNALEVEAIAANVDLKIAISRILQLDANVSREFSKRLPHVDISADFVNDETLLNPRSFGSPTKKLERVEQHAYSLLANFSYELDFTGKLKALQESACCRKLAAQWDYEFVYQTIVTQVAANYFALRILNEEICFLENALELRKDTVFLNQCRVEAGSDPEVNLSRAKLDCALIQIEIEEAKRCYALLEHALATLLGKPASSWTLEPAETLLPISILAVPSVLPADILLRRADIQRSIALMSAGRSDVDVALRSYFPSFSLTTAAGLASPLLSHLFQWQARYWSYLLELFTPLYDGGRCDADLLAAKAQFTEHFNIYIKTANQAFQEVEDALANFHSLQLQYEAQLEALEAANDTFYLSQIQFKAGLISYLLVADAENTLIEFKRNAIALQGKKILSWIHLIKAFGVQREEG